MVVAAVAAVTLAGGAAATGIAASAAVVVPTVTPAVDSQGTPRSEPAEAPVTTPPPVGRLGPADTNADTVTYTVTAPTRLGLAARDRSWVRVRTTDGGVLAETTLEAGDDTSVAINGNIEVRLGNPAGTTIRVNSQDLDLPAADRPLTVLLETGP
jgi:hypothetical protein